MAENTLFVNELLIPNGSKLVVDSNIDFDKTNSISKIFFSSFRSEDESHKEKDIKNHLFYDEFSDNQKFNYKESTIDFYELDWLVKNYQEAQEYLKFKNHYFTKKGYLCADIETKFYFHPIFPQIGIGIGAIIDLTFTKSLIDAGIILGSGLFVSELSRQYYKRKGRKTLEELLPQYKKCLEVKEKINSLPFEKHLFPEKHEEIKKILTSAKKDYKNSGRKNISPKDYISVEQSTQHTVRVNYDMINKMLLKTYKKAQ